MKRSLTELNSDESRSNHKYKKLWSEKSQRHYWFDSVTGRSVWEDPELKPTDKIEEKVGHINDQNLQDHEGSSDCPEGWKMLWSTKYNRNYWCNSETGESVWKKPTAATQNGNRNEETALHNLMAMLEHEKNSMKVHAPGFPRLHDKTDYTTLLHRLRTERANMITNTSSSSSSLSDYKYIFTLVDDDTAIITRALQEDQILKTRLKLRKGSQVIDLPSFWDVFNHSNGKLKHDMMTSSDPYEAMWSLQRKYEYKIATTFMPGYAKAIYEFFNAKNVLDPCAGWGDRLLGATCTQTPIVTKYIGFDPNLGNRPGYVDTMKVCGHNVIDGDKNHLTFANTFEIRSLPFEVGALELEENSFDLVFTSPPFFDYEMYNPNNPDYKDWIQEFYIPLMIQSCRVVRPSCHVAIHIGDTSAGNIETFLKEKVHTICSLKLIYRMGLRGVMSDKYRPVWIFQKQIS